MAIFGTNLSRENWESKYRYDGETPLGTFLRLARAAAEIEVTYNPEADLEESTEYFLRTLVDFRDYDPTTDKDPHSEDVYKDLAGNLKVAQGLYATTGGRITANLGTSYEKTTVLNCFINSPVSGATVTYQKKVPNTGETIDVAIKGEQTPDNLTNIFLTLLEAAETLKSEGGYGINFGFIRPRSSLIEGVGIRHPGSVSYLKLWDTMSSVIVQGDNDGYQAPLPDISKTRCGLLAISEDTKKPMKAQARKGAMMAVLPVWHPDIEEYILAKYDPITKTRLNNLSKFNLSVLIDDAFMEAVLEGSSYDLVFNGVVHKTIDARALYTLIVEAAYNTGDPGTIFLDNMNRSNPIVYLGPATASNPCGEIPGSSYIDPYYKPADYLKPYMPSGGAQAVDASIGFTTVCLLGSVNLTRFVSPVDRTFDYAGYSAVVEGLAKFLENVNDVGSVPLPAYDWSLKNIRQYGIGVNGLGSCLYMMGLRYGSQEGNTFIEDIHRIKDDVTMRTSALLAKERGPFPMYTPEYLETPYFKEHCKASETSKDLARKYGLRNAKRLTNPPLGNSSIICGSVSNGIEPVFSTGYERTVICDEWPEGLTQDNIHDILKPITIGDTKAYVGEYAGLNLYYEPTNRGLCFKEMVVDYGYKWVSDHFPEDLEDGATDYIVSAQDLAIDAHVEVQSIIQAYCDQSVSKTANVPNDFTFEAFKDLYIKAWRANLVGFTAYRAGIMAHVLDASDKDDNPAPLPGLRTLLGPDAEVNEDGVFVRDVVLPDTFVNGDTVKIKADGNKYYLHFSYLEEAPRSPIALWIHSNGLREGEYVSVNRGIKSILQLLKESGVEDTLVEAQVEKMKRDVTEHHVRLGKIISMALRHNIALPKVAGALKGLEGDHLASTLTAVRKFLTLHIEDGITVEGATCVSCCSSNLIYEGGCDRCLDCGHSGCG